LLNKDRSGHHRRGWDRTFKFRPLLLVETAGFFGVELLAALWAVLVERPPRRGSGASPGQEIFAGGGKCPTVSKRFDFAHGRCQTILPLSCPFEFGQVFF